MAKPKHGGKRAGGTDNNKYNGFSITDTNGNTKNYVVINGRVSSAEGSVYDGSFLSTNDVIQKLYDKFGNVSDIIDRINSVGKGKASAISDKTVEKMRDDYKKKREKSQKENYNPRISKKGVNRHRNNWSAM